MRTRLTAILRQRRTLFIILLLAAFVFRLGFGLSSEFWLEDEKQTYLIGLKFYATGEWPYFGPDVDYPKTIQQPGALQGLVVGLPLYLLPIAEAPFLLLNLLSFASLAFFAWYCTKRLPELPAWFIWLLLLTLPWTLNYSTHVVNLSYLLYYVALPVAVLYSSYCWSALLLRRRSTWLKVAKIVFACGLIFHTGLAIDNFSRKSLYLDRQIPQSAISARDYHLLGERRPGSRY